MKNLTFLTILISLFLFACPPKRMKLVDQTKMEEELKKKADELAHKFIITDGHVDLPYRLTVKNFRMTKEFIGIPIETDDGDFDYVRAK